MSTGEEYGILRCRGGFYRSGGPFAPPGTKPQYGRDRTFDVRHIVLELTVDIFKKAISGKVIHRIEPINDGLKKVTLDACELKIHRVEFQRVYGTGSGRRGIGIQAKYDYSDNRLTVYFPRPLKKQERYEVMVEYSATPRKGLYFILPDKEYPDRPVQVWSQGEDEDNRWWIPCWDYPNEKATSEMIVTVPENFFALSNGKLLEVRHDRKRKTKTYHWLEGVPHVSYLITLTIGEFVEVKQEWKGIPVSYYVPANRPDAEAEALRSFGNTPAMMEFFSERIGVPYPYEKYAQVCAHEFIFGGMENTSATTQTDLTLHDERAHLDFTSDPLVAHELAHQWWGDLLTCKDWSHGWLNEGFATYFEALWTEHHKGIDEFRYEMFQNAQNYFQEDKENYRRPIVTKTYTQPFSLFDRHLYEKGSLILHMIRFLLGDALWWKAIHHYCTKHKAQCVETSDFMKAIEEATGQNLEWFFDEWVFKGGHPELKVSYKWDDEKKVADITITQNQTVDDLTPLFRMPVDLEFHFSDNKKGKGKMETHRIEFSEKEQTFHIPLKEKPKWIAFDKGNWILKTAELAFPRDMLIAQLQEDDDCMGRIRAAYALAKDGSPEAVDALKGAMKKDSFWGVQAEAAKALSLIKGEKALNALKEGLKVKHPKARRGVVKALGNFRGEEPASVLLPKVKKDESVFVEAEAAASIGKTKWEKAFHALKETMKKDSWTDVIRRMALEGMVELRDERAIAVAEESARVGKPTMLRVSAIRALGKLGEDQTGARKTKILDTLTGYLEEPLFRIRYSAVEALGELRDDRAIPALQSLRSRELDARIKRRTEEVIRKLKEGKERPEEIKKLREDVDKLSEENRRIKDRLEKMETLFSKKKKG